MGRPQTLKSTLNFAITLVFTTAIAVPQYSEAIPKPASIEPTAKATAFDTGLVKKKIRLFDNFKVASGKSLSNSNVIYIDTTEVTFSKYWLRDNKTSISNRYKDKIKETYGKLIVNELQKALAKTTKADVKILAENTSEGLGRNGLRIKPYLRKLNIYAPDDQGPMKKSYVNAAGIATLVLEVTDVQSNSPIAYFRDRRETRVKLGPNNMDRATRTSNYHDFKMLIKRWSQAAAEQFAPS